MKSQPVSYKTGMRYQVVNGIRKYCAADIARNRLDRVIAIDRAANPVWRWVGTNTYTVRPKCSPIWGVDNSYSITYSYKRHCRWERRS